MDRRKSFTAVKTLMIFNLHKMNIWVGVSPSGRGDPTCAESSLAQGQEWFDLSF